MDTGRREEKNGTAGNDPAGRKELHMSFFDAAAGAVAGALTGAFFFGLLWITVRTIERTGRPTLLMISSFIGRCAAAAGVFLLLARATGPAGVAAGVAAFIAVRTVFIRRFGPRKMLNSETGGGGA